MKKKTIFYLLFSVILLIAFYVMIFYNNPNLKMSGQQTISDVRDFSFVSQYGDTVTLKNLKNKVAIISFFFATCQGICPKMNQELSSIYNQYKLDSNFLILTHTVEPEKDSVKALYNYASQFNITNKKWLFVTGNKIDLYQQARLSYALDDPNNNVGDIKDQFLHTQFVALANKENKVVGVYDIMLPKELASLKTDLKKILSQ